MAAGKALKHDIGVVLSVVISFVVSVLLAFALMPTVLHQMAYAEELIYSEGHVYSSEDGDERTEYKCKNGGYHCPYNIGRDGYNFEDRFCETLDPPTLSYLVNPEYYNSGGFEMLFSHTKAEVQPADMATIEQYVRNGEKYTGITFLKAGDADLLMEGTFKDGCKLKKKVSVHIEQYPFNVKKSYTIKKGGNPVVIEYTGEKEGKIEVPWLLDCMKATYSKNKSKVELQVISDLPTGYVNDSYTMSVYTYERAKGDTVWSKYPSDYHYPVLVFDYSGNSADNQPPETPTDKEIQALPAQTMKAYTTLVYPFTPSTSTGTNTTAGISVSSTNTDVATASYDNALKIEAKRAGTATLTIKADRAAYDYTMDITVNSVPVKAENIKTNNTGMRFNAMLGGNNVPEGAEVAIESKSVNDGEAYKKLSAAAENDVLGVYSVDLNVNGNSVHDDFGTIDMTFPVPESYKGENVKIHHLHEAGVSDAGSGSMTFQYTAQTSTGVSYTCTETVSFKSDGDCEFTTMDMEFPDGKSANAFVESLAADYGDNFTLDAQDGNRATVTLDNRGLHLNRSEYEQALKASAKDVKLADASQLSKGSITSEIVPVVNGEATITVSDLSTFALEAVPDKDNTDFAGAKDQTSSSSAAKVTGTPTQGATKNKTSVGGNLQKTGDSAAAVALTMVLVAALTLLAALALRRSKEKECQ